MITDKGLFAVKNTVSTVFEKVKAQKIISTHTMKRQIFVANRGRIRV